jgi:hypothetical protein
MLVMMKYVPLMSIETLMSSVKHTNLDIGLLPDALNTPNTHHYWTVAVQLWHTETNSHVLFLQLTLVQ